MDTGKYCISRFTHEGTKFVSDAAGHLAGFEFAKLFISEEEANWFCDKLDQRTFWNIVRIIDYK